MRFSPAISIVCAVIYSILTAFRGEIALIDGLFILFLLINAYNMLDKILLRLLKLNFFIVFIVGTIILAHGDMHQAITVFFRANLIIAVNIALFIRFSAEDFYYGFHSLRMPERFTVLLYLSIKYIDVLGREYAKLKEALRVRGFSPKTNLFTYRTYAYLAGMLLVRSMDRAAKLTECMRLRDFNGRLYPFNCVSFRMSDVLVVSMLIMQAVFSFGGII